MADFWTSSSSLTLNCSGKGNDVLGQEAVVTAATRRQVMSAMAGTVVADLSNRCFEWVLAESVDRLGSGPEATEEAIRVFLDSEEGREFLRRIQQGMLEGVRRDLSAHLVDALTRRTELECKLDSASPEEVEYRQPPLLEVATN